MTVKPEFVQEYVDRGDARIGLQVYPDPPGTERAPMVVICPAMGVRATYYRPFAEQLRAAGLTVAVADLRGTGTSIPTPSRACRYGYRELVADIGAVLDHLEPRLAGRTRVLLGHSLGGQVAVLHAALSEDPRIDGLALVAVGLPYWRGFPAPRRHLVLPYTQAIAATARLLRVWPGWSFGGRQARGVIRDWAYTARTGRFPALDGVDTESVVRQIRTPVLAISVDDDQYTPHATLDLICDKLDVADVRRHRYTVAEAGGARLDHFTWVRASGPLAARVAAFTADLPVHA